MVPGLCRAGIKARPLSILDKHPVNCEVYSQETSIREGVGVCVGGSGGRKGRGKRYNDKRALLVG